MSCVCSSSLPYCFARKLLSNGSMAEKKIDNLRKYMQLFPEYGVVWIGDSGQGDVVVAHQLVEDARAKHLPPPACFIHDVVRVFMHVSACACVCYVLQVQSACACACKWIGCESTILCPRCQVMDKVTQRGKTPKSERQRLAARGIHVFDTYVEAAFIAVQVCSPFFLPPLFCLDPVGGFPYSAFPFSRSGCCPCLPRCR